MRAMNTDLQSIVRSALDDAARRTGLDVSTLRLSAAKQ